MDTKGRMGLSTLYYATLQLATDVVGGTPTYDTPVALGKVSEADFDRAASLTSYFADDQTVAVGETEGDKKVSIKLLDVLPDAAADLFGWTYSAGQLVQGAGMSSNYVALGFRVTMENGEYEYWWIYKVLLGKPKSTFKTKGSSINFADIQIEGRMANLTANGRYAINQRSDDTNGVAATITAWFDDVVVAGGSSSPLSAVGSKSAGNVLITLGKTDVSSFNIVASTAVVPTGYQILSAGAAVPGSAVVQTGSGTSRTITFTPTTPFSGSQKVQVLVHNALKDSNNVGCTEYSIELTY